MYRHRILIGSRQCSTLAVILLFILVSPPVLGQSRLYQLTLKNGMKFEGKFSSIDEFSKDLTVRNVTPGGVPGAG